MRDEYPVGFGDLLATTFRYDPATGLLEKKHQTSGKWKLVTARHPQGHYICNLRVGDRNWTIPAHRAIFYLMKKRWPVRVKFINGDPTDLRWENIFEQEAGLPTQLERVQVGAVREQPSSPSSPAVLPPPDERKGKMKRWWKDVMECEKTAHPFSTGLWSATLKRELNPSEAMDVIRRKNEEDEKIQAMQEQAIMDCHPVFAELATAKQRNHDLFSASLREYGLWTGCTISTLYTFLAECNKHSLPPDSSTVVKTAYELKMSGEMALLPKWESDRWQGEVWLRAIRTSLYKEWEIEQFLADYTYLGETVPPPTDTWPEQEKEILANHGFTSLTAAVEEAYVRYGKKMEEEREKLEKFGEFS